MLITINRIDKRNKGTDRIDNTNTTKNTGKININNDALRKILLSVYKQLVELEQLELKNDFLTRSIMPIIPMPSITPSTTTIKEDYDNFIKDFIKNFDKDDDGEGSKDGEDGGGSKDGKLDKDFSKNVDTTETTEKEENQEKEEEKKEENLYERLLNTFEGTVGNIFEDVKEPVSKMSKAEQASKSKKLREIRDYTIEQNISTKGFLKKINKLIKDLES